jgi:hypothetical protein
MNPLIKRRENLYMLMTRVITCTQFKRDYVDVIDIRDTAQRVRWVEVWVKKV